MANCSQINNTTILGTSAVTYDGTQLPCTDINTCDDLNVVLAKLDAVICNATDNVNTLTEEVMNITEDVMLIGEDIININNQLNICCPTTTTTSSSSTSTTSTSTSTSSTTTTTTTRACDCITFYNGEPTIQEIEYNDCLGVTQYTIIQVGATKSYCGCCGVTHASLVTVTQGNACISGVCPTTTTTTTTPPTTTTTSSSSTSTTTSTSSTSTSTSSTSTTTTSTTAAPLEGCYSVTFDALSPECSGDPGHCTAEYTDCSGINQTASIPIAGAGTTLCVLLGPTSLEPAFICGGGNVTINALCV